MLLRRYLAIYALLWRNSIVREMSFKVNFVLWIGVELLWFGLQLCFVGVLYLHTDRIGTWSQWQVVMLVGASQLIQQLFTALFLTNLTQLSDYVRTGKLDFLLLLPVNTRFLISWRQVDLGAFFNMGTAAAVMVYAARQMHYVPSLGQVAAFLALAGFGLSIHYSLMFIMASASFWTVQAQGIIWGYYNLFNLTRIPDDAFRGLFKVFFTYALPLLLVVSVPVRALIEKLNSARSVFWLIGLSIVCFWVSARVWKFSLRHYTSAST